MRGFWSNHCYLHAISTEASHKNKIERRILNRSMERICPQIHLQAILNMALLLLKQCFFPYFLLALPFFHHCIAYSPCCRFWQTIFISLLRKAVSLYLFLLLPWQLA